MQFSSVQLYALVFILVGKRLRDTQPRQTLGWADTGHSLSIGTGLYPRPGRRGGLRFAVRDTSHHVDLVPRDVCHPDPRTDATAHPRPAHGHARREPSVFCNMNHMPPAPLQAVCEKMLSILGNPFRLSRCSYVTLAHDSTDNTHPPRYPILARGALYINHLRQPHPAPPAPDRNTHTQRSPTN